MKRLRRLALNCAWLLLLFGAIVLLLVLMRRDCCSWAKNDVLEELR